jgi:hypothetical protein
MVETTKARVATKKATCCRIFLHHALSVWDSMTRRRILVTAIRTTICTTIDCFSEVPFLHPVCHEAMSKEHELLPSILAPSAPLPSILLP